MLCAKTVFNFTSLLVVDVCECTGWFRWTFFPLLTLILWITLQWETTNMTSESKCSWPDNGAICMSEESYKGKTSLIYLLGQRKMESAHCHFPYGYLWDTRATGDSKSLASYSFSVSTENELAVSEEQHFASWSTVLLSKLQRILDPLLKRFLLWKSITICITCIIPQTY